MFEKEAKERAEEIEAKQINMHLKSLLLVITEKQVSMFIEGIFMGLRQVQSSAITRLRKN